jgi:hypothetical protein
MLEELVYSAAQRALDQQSTALSDLRTRTSTLVAAATLSASFLGAAAIGRGAPAWAVVLAMTTFLSTGAFAGWVLWPARVLFALDADRVEEELFPYREDPEAGPVEESSIMISTSAAALAGTFCHSKGGEILAPSHVYCLGSSPLSSNAELVISSSPG